MYIYSQLIYQGTAEDVK